MAGRIGLPQPESFDASSAVTAANMDCTTPSTVLYWLYQRRKDH